MRKENNWLYEISSTSFTHTHTHTKLRLCYTQCTSLRIRALRHWYRESNNEERSPLSPINHHCAANSPIPINCCPWCSRHLRDIAQSSFNDKLFNWLNATDADLWITFMPYLIASYNREQPHAKIILILNEDKVYGNGSVRYERLITIDKIDKNRLISALIEIPLLIFVI